LPEFHHYLPTNLTFLYRKQEWTTPLDYFTIQKILHGLRSFYIGSMALQSAKQLLFYFFVLRVVLPVSCGCLFRNPHIRRRRCPIQFPKNCCCWIPIILRRWIPIILRCWKRSIPIRYFRFRPRFLV